MKRAILIVVIILLLSSSAFAESNSPNEMFFQINDQFFKTEQIQDFTNAAELFHYPRSYSLNELDKDKQAVKLILNYFYQSFGKILSYKLLEKAEPYIALAIGGGDASYWAQNPNYIRTVYETQFSNEGQGYVIIDLCKINDKYQIRYVHYGLPISRKDCQKRIQEIYSGMMEVLKMLEENEQRII